MLDNLWTPVGWSTDKTRMAFVRFDTKDQSSALVIADADGGSQRVLTTRKWPAQFASAFFSLTPPRPAWSPDDRVIAVLGGNLRSEVLFVDVASGTQTVVESGGGFPPAGIAWLNSNALVVSQPPAQNAGMQLWHISYPQGAVARITNDLSSYYGVDLDGERDVLVTTRSDTRAALWVGDTIGQNAQEIVSSWRAATNSISVAWAGDRVVYDATSPGTDVASVPAAGGTPSVVSQNGLAAAATSDGATVVFMRPDARDSGLWKIDAAHGQAVQLVAGTAWHPMITADDKFVVFISDRSGIGSPWIVPLEGGTPREIVRAFASFKSIDVSADGKRLLFLSSNAQSQFFLVVCDFPSCSNRRTIPLPRNFQYVQERWTPDGNSIAYVDYKRKNISSVTPDRAEPQQITHITDDAIAGIARSRDGKRLAIVRATTTNDVVRFKGLRR
jgi:Tol biopolymer transport system component